MSALPGCLAEEIREWAAGVWQILTPPPWWREMSGVERHRWMSRALEETRPLRRMIGELQKLYGDEVAALIAPRTSGNTCDDGEPVDQEKYREFRVELSRKLREEQAKKRGGS